MKKVIFICLLTLSLCLGKPAETGPTPKTPDNVKPDPSPATQKATEVTSVVPTVVTDATTTKTDKSTTTTVAPTSITTPASTNKPDKPETTTKVAPTVVTTTLPPKTTTVPSTIATSTVKPSEASNVPVQARGFDGASFIGGIILTLGLLAIGFMGFKYYKNQTERNYHTL